MDANKVLINGESLDVILRHYYAIPTLVRHALLTKSSGGTKALEEWDKRRKETLNDVKIKIS
jgi:hypothetical protein